MLWNGRFIGVKMDELYVVFSKFDNKLIRYEFVVGLLYNVWIK